MSQEDIDELPTLSELINKQFRIEEGKIENTELLQAVKIKIFNNLRSVDGSDMWHREKEILECLIYYLAGNVNPDPRLQNCYILIRGENYIICIYDTDAKKIAVLSPNSVPWATLSAVKVKMEITPGISEEYCLTRLLDLLLLDSCGAGLILDPDFVREYHLEETDLGYEWEEPYEFTVENNGDYYNCDACGNRIHGVGYHCKLCENYDLCEECHRNLDGYLFVDNRTLLHCSDHPTIRFETRHEESEESENSADEGEESP